MIDSLKDSLKEIQKSLEKSLIRSLVASTSKATSDTRKQVIREMETTSIEGLKSSSTGYLESFKATANGQWVKQAQQAFKDTTQEFD